MNIQQQFSEQLARHFNEARENLVKQWVRSQGVDPSDLEKTTALLTNANAQWLITAPTSDSLITTEHQMWANGNHFGTVTITKCQDSFHIETQLTEVPLIVACNCFCHKPGIAAMHFRACCEGMCLNCGKWFYKGLKEHEVKCGK